MITINRKTLIITSIVMIILLSLSIGGNVYAGAARASIESTGRLEINDPLGGGTIVLDSQDIQDNANNIKQLNSNLTANSQPFRFGYQDGKYGYITTEGGADTFSPFSRPTDIYHSLFNDSSNYVKTLPIVIGEVVGANSTGESEERNKVKLDLVYEDDNNYYVLEKIESTGRLRSSQPSGSSSRAYSWLSISEEDGTLIKSVEDALTEGDKNYALQINTIGLGIESKDYVWVNARIMGNAWGDGAWARSWLTTYTATYIVFVKE